MYDQPDNSPPPPDINEELSLLALQLKGAATARRIWHTLLTPEERKPLEFESFLSSHLVDQWVTLRGVTRARAILDLAWELDILSEKRYRFFLRAIGEEGEAPAGPEKPTWNRDRCELLFRGRVVRRLRGPKVAKNVSRILDAFEEEGWPDRIDDPLPGGRKPRRLRGTVATLNRGLTALKFRADGEGEGILW